MVWITGIPVPMYPRTSRRGTGFLAGDSDSNHGDPGERTTSQTTAPPTPTLYNLSKKLHQKRLETFVLWDAQHGKVDGTFIGLAVQNDEIILRDDNKGEMVRSGSLLEQ